MKRLLSICFVLILALSCITPVYATEITTPVNITLPELPDYVGDPNTVSYKIEKAVLKVGTDYYAIIYEDAISSTISGFGIKSYSNSAGTICYGITFYPYVYRTETYKLSEDGTTWVLVYVSDDGTSSINFALKDESGMSYDSWHEGYAAKTIAVYSTYSTINISSRDRLPNGYYYAVAPTDYYNVSFTGGSVDGGDSTEPTEPGSGGSTEDGGNNSWSDEDKNTLGGWFQSILNKLSDTASSITTSISNFINSAVSSVGSFFNNLTSTIIGSFNTLSTWIDTARTKLEEFFTGIWSSVQDWWTNTISSWWLETIESIKTWWAELFQPVSDWFTAQKEEAEAITEAFTSFFDSIIMLFEAVFDYSYEESGGGADGTT